MSATNDADRYAELVVGLERYDGPGALKWGLRCIDAKACNTRELAATADDVIDD